MTEPIFQPMGPSTVCAMTTSSRNLELNETLRYLEKNVNETERKANKDKNKGTAVYSTFELKTNATVLLISYSKVAAT